MLAAGKEVAARQMTTCFNLVREHLREHELQPANLLSQASKRRLQAAFQSAVGVKTKCIAKTQDRTWCTKNAKHGMYCGIPSYRPANTDL